MYVYAGIDEAGYGPMFGPLLVGRMVLGISPPEVSQAPESQEGDAGSSDSHERWTGRQLWKRLSKAVCHDVAKRRGRIVVNDSKKLLSAREEHAGSLAHVEHLERGVLAFAALGGKRTTTVGHWLDSLGESCHHNLEHLPWYAPTQERPWGVLPAACTPGEIAVARSLLAHTAAQIGLEVLDVGAAVVFEDRFNQMVTATRSKASASFTFVSGHLRTIWDRFGQHHPNVVVDRQSGRMHYRELLALTFPEAEWTVMEETPLRSEYRMTEKAAGPDAAMPPRAMTISFEVDSEAKHMPVALASMVSKYTRELLMARFQAWFIHHAPQVRPTAGYATDARRFWEEIQPVLPTLAIDGSRLARMC